MAANRTSISAGMVIRSILASTPAVAEKTKKIFPVVSTETAILPYILYRRSTVESIAAKIGVNADTTQIEVLCYTKDYGEGVDLAEEVREALDHAQGTVEGIRMRSCTYEGGEETWEDDAFIQQLIFSVKI